MGTSGFTTISISQLKGIREIPGNIVTDRLFLSEKLETKLDILQYPCRINAVTFALCTRGSITISSNLKQYRMEEGCVMINSPENILHVIDKSDDFSARIMMFDPDFIRDIKIELKTVIPIHKYIIDNANNLKITAAEYDLLQKYFVLIGDTINSYKPEIIHDLLAAFFRTISEIYSRRLSEVPSPRTRQEDYFLRFMNLLAEHHKQERSVSFYADELHITPKYLSSVIKEVTGKSAATWIDEYVIQEAKILLKFSNKSIQEITYHLNFSTQSFFGKYFKRHTGISPSEYRAS